MTECTFCPPNTKQCAHLDGHWARLTVGIDCINSDGVPAVTWNFGYPEPVPSEIHLGIARYTWTIFYFPPSTLAGAKENFHKLNEEMRKIASEET